ncbi:MAG: hypothetical protein ACLP8A_02925 [Methylovirgula sp.]
MAIKTKLAAVSVAAVLAVSAASTAFAACHMRIMHHMSITTDGGKEMSLEVVRIDGHMMVLVPETDAPDVFHQKPFIRR